MNFLPCQLVSDTHLYEFDRNHWMLLEVLSHTGKLYPGIHGQFQVTSEALVMKISQKTHQWLQIPEKSSLQILAEYAWNFRYLAYWKRQHICLEFRVIFRGEMTSYLFLRRRHTLKRSSNSCCQSQMRIDVRAEPVCLALPRSLPPSSRRQGLVVLFRVRPIGFILYMIIHVHRTDKKAFHSSHIKHLWIPSTIPRFYQCEMED